MTNFTVGPTPLQVIGQGLANNPLTVQNTGAVSVYISADPGVSPNAFEYKIDAGGDFIWPSGKALSVCTSPGVIGQISYGGSGTVHVNSGSTNVSGAVTINGSVPISGPVTVSGTVGISGGTVALSGPVSISGGVSVTGSTINIGNAIALGCLPQVIYNANVPIGATAGTYMPTVNNATIVTKFLSVIVILTVTKTGGGNFLPIQTNYISLVVSAGGAIYTPQWLYVTQNTGPANVPYQKYIQIPVSDTNLLIWPQVTVGAGFAGNLNITVLGLGQAINAPVYVCDGDGFQGTIPEGGLFIAGAVNVNSGPNYVGARNGKATISVLSYAGANGYMRVSYVESGILQPFAALLATGATVGTGPIAEIRLPMRPIAIDYFQTGVGSYSGAMMQED